MKMCVYWHGPGERDWAEAWFDETTIFIGTSLEAHIYCRPDDVRVGRLHIRASLHDEGIEVAHHGSTNHVYVDGTPIDGVQILPADSHAPNGQDMPVVEIGFPAAPIGGGFQFRFTRSNGRRTAPGSNHER